MPQAAAIFGLRMMARTWVPIGKRYMMNQVRAVRSNAMTMMMAAVDVHIDPENGRRSPSSRPAPSTFLKPRAEALDVAAEKGGAEFEPHGLLKQDRHAPGGEQRIEQPPVKMADDELFDRKGR